MEPITTTAIISAIATYIAKTIKDNKSFKELGIDLTSATSNWFRSILLIDDKPKEVLADLEADPEDKLNRDALENAIAKALKREPQGENYLQEIYAAIKAKGGDGQGVTNYTNNADNNSGTVIQIAGNNNQFNQK